MLAPPSIWVGFGWFRPGCALKLIGLGRSVFALRTVYLVMGVSAPRGIAFAVHGPIEREDLPGLCDRVCALLEQSRAEIAYCNVAGVEPDAVTIDALARLQLAARRSGCQVRLRHASDDLLDLVAFMGLADVLPD